ncbi:MAG: hypothetical protein COA33_002110 [Fluviicola sp.]|nr:hypothetical protein [Fluviicola sp.]
MKNKLIASIIFLSSFGSFGQIDAGTIVAGGFASFNQRSFPNSQTSVTSLSIQPQLGVAFVDNFVGGAWFQFNSFSSFRSWSVSPFLRYYVKNFFLQAGYGYSYSKVANITSEGSIIDVEIGYAAFLNEYVALEPVIYYNGGFRGKEYSYTDIGIKIGFQIYFNR